MSPSKKNNESRIGSLPDQFVGSVKEFASASLIAFNHPSTSFAAVTSLPGPKSTSSCLAKGVKVELSESCKKEPKRRFSMQENGLKQDMLSFSCSGGRSTQYSITEHPAAIASTSIQQSCLGTSLDYTELKIERKSKITKSKTQPNFIASICTPEAAQVPVIGNQSARQNAQENNSLPQRGSLIKETLEVFSSSLAQSLTGILSTSFKTSKTPTSSSQTGKINDIPCYEGEPQISDRYYFEEQQPEESQPLVIKKRYIKDGPFKSSISRVKEDMSEYAENIHSSKEDLVVEDIEVVEIKPVQDKFRDFLSAFSWTKLYKYLSLKNKMYLLLGSFFAIASSSVSLQFLLSLRFVI
jgi:hypothetical protein